MEIDEAVPINEILKRIQKKHKIVEHVIILCKQDFKIKLNFHILSDEKGVTTKIFCTMQYLIFTMSSGSDFFLKRKPNLSHQSKYNNSLEHYYLQKKLVLKTFRKQ
jgi:hypothetical protein